MSIEIPKFKTKDIRNFLLDPFPFRVLKGGTEANSHSPYLLLLPFFFPLLAACVNFLCCLLMCDIYNHLKLRYCGIKKEMALVKFFLCVMKSWALRHQGPALILSLFLLIYLKLSSHTFQASLKFLM